MKFFEVAKRVVPFGIALIIGIVLAFPFASAPIYDKPVGSFTVSEDLRSENRRLRKENCRMKWQMKRLKRSTVFDHELTVPEPPMPPMPPVAPEAPPAPPPPPAARVHRTDR